MTRYNPLIFCAIDTNDFDRAVDLAKTMTPLRIGIKLGLEFFNKFGPQGVRSLLEKAGDPALFLDLKFHDIPNTVAGAVRSIVHLSPQYFNVHCAGGAEMMKAAREAAHEETSKNSLPMPLILGVTVLTSLDETDMAETGQTGSTRDQADRLAALARESGLDGVVCSPADIKPLRNLCGIGFKLMVPGIRPEGSNKDDQKRTATPVETLKAGANHIVIGRPITQAKIPAMAAQNVLDEIQHSDEI